MNMIHQTTQPLRMDRKTSTSLRSNPYPIPESSRTLTIVAWVTTIFISVLPDILFIVLTGDSPAWLITIRMGLLLILALAAAFCDDLRPLRNYFIMLFAFFGLSELRQRFNFTIPALQALLGGSFFDSCMQAEQTGKLAVSLCMIVILLVLGYQRKEFFLNSW